jgi:phosphatidylserine/phosphatidylglycerophosphate/cardiolipin synthase-like enzyme
MQRVLSSGLWTAIRAQAQRAHRRKAAIAYVTRDLVGFRKADVLVVDASEYSIACGDTDAKLLRTLQRKGVLLYHCADLHAKVLQLDDVAVIGSGNMSSLSASRLVEAAVMTDHSSVVSGAASFIEQLMQQADELDPRRITQLCKIRVVRRGGRRGAGRGKRVTKLAPLGSRTWLVGVHELVRDPPPDEQRMIDRAAKTLRARAEGRDEDPNWVRWGRRGLLPRDCREGDSLIQIWRSSGAKRPSAVLRVTPVLLKQRAKRWTRFYLGEAAGRYPEVKWAASSAC